LRLDCRCYLVGHCGVTKQLELFAAARKRGRSNFEPLCSLSRADPGLVFADERGDVLDLDLVSKAFAKLAHEAKIKTRGISLHSLRHCAATMALQSGADVRTVSALLGHPWPPLSQAQARAVGCESGRD